MSRRAALCLLVALAGGCGAAPLHPVHDYGLDAAASPLAIGKGARGDPVPVESPLELTLEEAVLLALRNNRSLRVAQLRPAVARTFEELERARFDPTVDATISIGRGRSDIVTTSAPEHFGTKGEALGAAVGVRQELPSGTGLDLSFSSDRARSDRTPTLAEARVGLTVTQALLRGASWEANLASVEQARLDAVASDFELRGFTEALVADVEATFWEYQFAGQELEIFERSHELARQHLDDTLRRVDVGVTAATELAAARAEVARRHEALINARSRQRRMQLTLLRLMNPVSREGWDLELIALADVLPPVAPLGPVEAHVTLARQMRPELNEAKLLLERGRLEVVRTRNGLLPRLDLFVTLGKTGYADSFAAAWRDMGGRGYDLEAGVRFSLPIGNRAANAAHQAARLGQRQAEESLDNLEQLIDFEVRVAYLEVRRAEEQIDATQATRELREETLRAEAGKFRVGASTAFLVAQAQRDLLESQIAEALARTRYRQTVIELYRLDGTLLLRRSIRAPGERRPRNWDGDDAGD